jgi:HisA/HisF family protein
VAGFDIIPVIDLKGGKAVHAAGGNRADYRPLATPLCPDGDPVTAAKGLLGVCPARMLYIADLDAIERQAVQRRAIERLGAALPDVALWIDNGSASPQDQLALKHLRPVLGSESLTATPPYIPPQTVLSLDFRGDRFLGPRSLLDGPACWPQDIIVMTLHRVGAGRGPDLRRLSDIIAMAGAGRRVYAAGGARNLADLHALVQTGAAGVLIASALHSGAITAPELASFTPGAL